MEVKLKFKPHTMILLVGPTESGKSTFAKEVLIPGLSYIKEDSNFKMNVQYISSDEIRRELLGYDYDKHDSIMLESSELAFDLMYKKINVVTSFPINAEFVVIDTTGLSELFRQDMMEIAKNNNYNLDVVVFNYKDMKDYYESDKNKRLIVNHVTRLRRDVLKDLRSSDYNNIYSIKKKNFLLDGKVNEDYKVEVSDLDYYASHFLPSEYEYSIIGDVHEQVETLKELLVKKKFIFEGNQIVGNERHDNVRVVLVGDWIDKGNNTEEMINFLLENEDYFYLVKGNHENFVYKYLKGDKGALGVDKEILNNQFTSVKTLINNEELKNKFYGLVEKSKVFYAYKGTGSKSFYVTHAPCENKYIGKLDNFSIKKQLRFSISREENLESQLKFIKDEGVFNFPYHVFGHVATQEGFKLLNKISIDTGSVYGNKLTSVSFNSNKSFFYSAVSNLELVEKLDHIFKAKPKSVNLKDLDRDDLKKLYFAADNKINYISGTMAPADKDLENEVLESLEKGLDYFNKKGVKKVILQPKYMGSRCNIYLNKNIEESFAVSRNGYKIKRVDLTEVYELLTVKFGKYMEDNHIKLLILDGELLPWSVLGEGLIENSFKPVEVAVGKEISLLNKYNFEKNFDELNDLYEESGFKFDRNQVNKKELSKKYGDKDYSTFKSLEGYKHVHNDVKENMWKVFKEQVELYGESSETRFSCFNILKIVKEDNTEEYFEGDAEELFKFVSEDEYVVINLDNEEDLTKAREFYETLTVEKKMEGVVIKPLVEKVGVLPFMKVRNEKYLTIVYGYDYKLPHKYGKLLNQKSINMKVNTSLKEHELGKAMLRIKRDDIHDKNEEFKQIVANLLFEVKKESTIDPRL
jgi:predicted kinase